MHALPLLGRYVSASMRAQMQYPGSAIMLAIGSFAVNIIDVLAIWALFDRFGAIHGWRLGDVCLFFGMVSISFALSEFVTRGFDVFGTAFVRTGAFDRILLRPRSAALQLVGHELRFSRFGRLIQGLTMVVAASLLLDLRWDAPMIALAAWTLLGGMALFVGLMIFQAVLAFWTVESLEMVNAVTYGGVQAAQFPLSLYAEWLRNFLIFIVPLACVAYYPVLAILGKPDPLGAPDWLLPLAPAAGFAFLAAAFGAWRFGVAHYTSTGS